MVDEMTQKPAGRCGRPLLSIGPYNLKGKRRCRHAAGAAGRHISDNHKSQDAQARIRRTIERKPKKLVTPAKGGATVGKPSECA